jgi:hypothetical protein
MSERDQWGAILDALSDSYRRQPLVALLQHNPQDDEDSDPLNIVADADEDRQLLEAKMVHVHLPKLEKLGFIAWDPEENRQYWPALGRHRAAAPPH